MTYKIDKQKIVNWVFNNLPDIHGFNKRIIVVYVADFIGESEIIAQSWHIEIDLPNKKSLIIDRKELSYYYYVVFQKSKNDDGYYWDLIGYDKRKFGWDHYKAILNQKPSGHCAQRVFLLQCSKGSGKTLQLLIKKNYENHFPIYNWRIIFIYKRLDE